MREWESNNVTVSVASINYARIGLNGIIQNGSNSSHIHTSSVEFYPSLFLKEEE